MAKSNLNDILQFKKVGGKSVPTPSAQSTTSCAPGNAQISAIESKVIYLIGSKSLSVQDRLLIDLLYFNGLRISEALNICYSDIRKDGSIFVKGLKGSENRLIRSVYFNSYLTSLFNLFEGRLFTTSRFYYYRLFKKLGLYLHFEGNSVNSVTHVFRHIYASSIMSDTGDLDLVKRQVGHKSIKTTAIYAHSKVTQVKK